MMEYELWVGGVSRVRQRHQWNFQKLGYEGFQHIPAHVSVLAVSDAPLFISFFIFVAAFGLTRTRTANEDTSNCLDSPIGGMEEEPGAHRWICMCESVGECMCVCACTCAYCAI